MEKIKDYSMWSGSDPLTLRVTGSGKYVMDFLCNLVENFANAEYDHEQNIRSDVEGDISDTLYHYNE